MNSKAIRKQLFAAVAMVLVAAVALGSSTYAWFAQNNTVTAESMTLSVQTTTNLSISKTSSTEGYGTSIAFDNGEKASSVDPVTLVAKVNGAFASIGTSGTTQKIDPGTNKENIKFYKIDADNPVRNPASSNAENPIAGQLITGTGAVSDYFTLDNAGDNYLTNRFWIKYDANTDASQAIKMTVTVKDADNSNTAINRAFHVGVLVYGTTTETNKFYNFDMSATTPSAGVYTFVEQTNFVTLTSGTPVQFDVFCWYEGEDSDCTTVNAVAIDELQVGFTFETDTTV